MMSTALSRDGTEIAYWSSGQGPPVVLVHGAPADHTRWDPLLPYLEPHASVHAMDRRGRGASGDGPEYDIRREAEDIAAVVDAVAQASGSPVDVYGHSFGGLVAFGAPPLTSNIGKLALYEGWPIRDPSVYALPADVEQQMQALLAEGEREAVLETVLRAELSDDDIRVMRSLPSWQARVAAAHTLPRELHAFLATGFDTAQAARVAVPTLLITGQASTDPTKADIETVAAAIPDARIVILEGQQHVADIAAPQVFSERLLVFLRDVR